jgi:hypothetical protein
MQIAQPEPTRDDAHPIATSITSVGRVKRLQKIADQMQPENRLCTGGRWIRTIGPAVKETAVERQPAANHRRLARRPVLNNPRPAYRSGRATAERPFSQKRGTDGSNPVPSTAQVG